MDVINLINMYFCILTIFIITYDYVHFCVLTLK